MTNIQVFYRGQKIEGYTLDTNNNQIYGKTGKALKYQKDNRYVFVGGHFAKVETVVNDSLKAKRVEEHNSVTPETKEEPIVPVVEVVRTKPNEFKEWVSMNLQRAEAMEILEKADDFTYWEFQDTARKHIECNGIIGADEYDIMVELVIINYIEPRNTVKGKEMRREYEYMTFEEIANELDLPVDGNHADALREYWTSVIRRTYVDKIQYRRGVISIREFGNIVCPLETFRDVVGTWKLMVALFGERRLLY